MKINKTLLLLMGFCWFLGVPAVYAGTLVPIKIQAQGEGATRQQAVNDALTEAVSQVGASLSADQKMNLSEISKDDKTTTNESYQSKTELKTAGDIQQYRITQENRTGNIYTITLEAIVITYKKSKQTNRKRIIVTPFTIIDTNVQNASDINRRLYENISDFLVQTRKFAVLDRQNLTQQDTELNFLKNTEKNGVNPFDAARIGNRLGTDLMVIGTIHTLQHSTKTRKSSVSNRIIKSFETIANINIKIIDVATTQIKYAKTINFAESKSLNDAIIAISQNIGTDIIESIYPIRVVAYGNPNILTLNRGADTMQRGQVFDLFVYGDMLIDPNTGEKLGRQETQIGQIKITDIQPKVSYAQILHSDMVIGAQNFKKLVIRKSKGTRKISVKSLKQGKQSPTIQQLQQQSEKDW